MASWKTWLADCAIVEGSNWAETAIIGSEVLIGRLACCAYSGPSRALRAWMCTYFAQNCAIILKVSILTLTEPSPQLQHPPSHTAHTPSPLDTTQTLTATPPTQIIPRILIIPHHTLTHSHPHPKLIPITRQTRTSIATCPTFTITRQT